MSRNARRLIIVVGIAAVVVILRLTVFRPAPVTVFKVEKGRVEETVVNSRAGTVKAERDLLGSRPRLYILRKALLSQAFPAALLESLPICRDAF